MKTNTTENDYKKYVKSLKKEFKHKPFTVKMNLTTGKFENINSKK